MSFVFVSHQAEDEAVARWLGELLDAHFLGLATAFVSSDGRSLRAGEPWFSTLREQIRGCQVMIVLCTGQSVVQPWVNFEFGAAWALGKVVVPVCIGEFTPEKLDMPFSEVQGVDLLAPDGIEAIFNRIAAELGSRVPAVDFISLAGQVPRTPDRPAAVNDVTRRRVHEALTRSHQWRTLTRVAVEAGLSEAEALQVLQADEDVVFSSNPRGVALVGLRSRVRR